MLSKIKFLSLEYAYAMLIYDGAICTLWVFFFVILGINALKFCKIEAQYMLRQ